MKILFLLIFATISTSTGKFKNETVFKSDGPNIKVDETTVKNANSDSTESEINLNYTLQSNNESTSLFNKAEIENSNQKATTTNNNFSNEKLLDAKAKDAENGTSSPVKKFQATTEIKISATTEYYYLSSNSSNIESPNEINNDNIADNKDFEENEKNRSTLTNKINTETENVTQNLKENEVIENATNSPESKKDQIEKSTKIESTTNNYKPKSTSIPNIQSVNVIDKNKYLNATNSTYFHTENNTESTAKDSKPANETNYKILNANTYEKLVTNSFDNKDDSKSTNELESSTTEYKIDAPTTLQSKNAKHETISDEISTTLPSETKNVELKKSGKSARIKLFLSTTDEIPTQSSVEAFRSTRDQFFYQNHLVKNGRFLEENPSSSSTDPPPSSTDPPPSSSYPPSSSTDAPPSSTDPPHSSTYPPSSSTDPPPSSSYPPPSSSDPPPSSSDAPTSSTDAPTSSTDTSPITTTTTEEPTSTTTTTEQPTTINPCTEMLQVGEVDVISSPFTLQLNWSDPLPDCKFEYEIKWEKSKHRTIYSGAKTNETEYTIYYLDACEDYKINITILYSKDVYNPKEIVAKTSEYMSAVEEITSGPAKFNDDKNLTVSWTIPSNVQKCLKEYIITSYKDDQMVQTFSTKDNSTTFYRINSCINNTYLISSHSEHMSTTPKSITFLDPEINDPPVYNEKETEIYDDFVITKWDFGAFICRPEAFKIECTTDNEKPIEKLETITGEIHLLNNSLTAKVKVVPYTNYTCYGIISNTKGDSKRSEPGEFLTNSKAPDNPMNIITSQSEKNLEISWDEPQKWNGNPEGYSITTEFVGFNYVLPVDCNYERTFSTTTEHVFEPSYNFPVIIPASTYRITIKAISDGGMSKAVTKEVNISEAVPDAPKNFVAFPILSTENKTYSAYVDIRWGTNCKPRGQLEKYILKVRARKGNNEEVMKDVTLSPDIKSYKTNPYLKVEYNYTIQLIAGNREFDSITAETTFIAPAGIPNPPNITKLKMPDTSGLAEPWNSAVVYISKNIFDEVYGEIKYVSIIVAEPGCEEKAKDEYYNSNEWPKVASDDLNCVNESRAYEATDPKWEPFSLPTKSSGEVNFTLGKNQSCNNVLDCNRPLKPSTTYCIKLRAFTSHGYRDNIGCLHLQTEEFSDVPVGLIVGLIIGILAIAFIIAAVLFYTKGKLNFKNWPRMESASQISPAPLPVAIKKFGSHYEKMIENPGKIKNEFQLLSTISSDVTLSTKTALLPHNKKKNRYINILPYDQTRVQLASANENSSDYINASYIKGYSGSNEYIATQGPTEATCPTFWQMIIEQNVKLIVMLTQFVESGKDKCYKYFPELKEEYDLPNDIKIQCTEEEIMNVYNKRVFKVKKGNLTKKVTHMQFNLWPDFGVPDEVHYMLDFCETIKEIKLKKPSIIVMHCSAGVGRTGTLIAVDILLQNIRDKRKVDIFGTVLNLRKQRMNMVQSERQYEFLYKCLYHVITNKISTTSSKHNLNQICESNML